MNDPNSSFKKGNSKENEERSSDITNRKRAEDIIPETEIRFKMIVENSYDLI